MDKLPVIVLGQAEQAQVGDVVLAIGNPFGVGQTVTMGIISALGRNNLHINHFENFIQTDAAINFGNSGGRWWMPAATCWASTRRFIRRPAARSASALRSRIDRQERDGSHHQDRPRGARLDRRRDAGNHARAGRQLRPERQSGAIIAGVVRNGPADKGGIKPGDILLSVDDKPVADTNSMLNLIAQLVPGGKAKMTVLRKNRETTLDVTVGKRPANAK
jgi:serine protease DegQ